jgi:hypothetical protein
MGDQGAAEMTNTAETEYAELCEQLRKLAKERHALESDDWANIGGQEDIRFPVHTEYAEWIAAEALSTLLAREERLREALSKTAIKAEAGLCQMTAGGKHEFLRDISLICEANGFDVLGDPVPRAALGREPDARLREAERLRMANLQAREDADYLDAQRRGRENALGESETEPKTGKDLFDEARARALGGEPS